jgi:polyisoprenoid-binding protein YceI
MTTTINDDAVQVPRAGRYAIDSRGSTLTFRSRHLFGLAPVRGTMAIRHGLVDVADPITDSSVEVEIDATTRIDRTDFGLTASRGMAGRHLDVSLRILGVGR